jgi:peptidoglycan hydrolase CwlO-like protein
MNPILTTVLPIIITAGLTWFLGRQKSKAEVRKMSAEAVSLEIGNAQAVINFWKESCQDLTEKLTMLSDKVDELMDELELVRKENSLLKMKLENVGQKLT